MPTIDRGNRQSAQSTSFILERPFLCASVLSTRSSRGHHRRLRFAHRFDCSQLMILASDGILRSCTRSFRKHGNCFQPLIVRALAAVRHVEPPLPIRCRHGASRIPAEARPIESTSASLQVSASPRIAPPTTLPVARSMKATQHAPLPIVVSLLPIQARSSSRHGN
ncbi:hypothetical protein BC834DRAFT_622222 [Gloeopeniophorella convolvens]|nr:hypothetical protein BC834DRAFT_622222 [Gloeopeniophorella convolvens]